MKIKLEIAICCLLFALCLSVFGQGTAFTYQGRLNNNGTPVTGSYDLQFILFTTNQFGFPGVPILTNAAVTVNNGLFTTTLDFGGVFTGSNYWLDISVRTNGNGTFNELSPRQPITPAPYAITAETAETVNNLPGLTVQQNTNGAPNLIGGSPNNFVASGVIGATIAGGGATNDSDISPPSPTNSVTADFGTVSGGGDNIASGFGATVGGGFDNTSGESATVGGGEENIASGFGATVGGGLVNRASGTYATVGGGEENTAFGNGATVPGGEFNLAEGEFSFAAGGGAEALHDGAFVWADSQDTAYASDRANQFKIRAGGGMVMDVSGSSGLNPAAVTINSTSGNGIGLVVNESSSDTAALFANNGTGDIIKGFSGGGNTVFEVLNDGTVKSKNVTLTSDRNAKENFKPLDAQTILEKIVSLPLMEWNYKTDNKDVQHIGPMAQDFHAAFQLDGADDKHISVVDEGGVALAAIQGLNQKLEKKDAEILELKQRLEALEKIVLNQKSN